MLVGTNQGPTPVEFLLHAIAACLTSGLANIAAARGITLRRVSSTVEGDIDLLGILGLSDEVRNGYRQIRVHFDVEGDASPEELAALVERSRRRSAVYDVLVNGTDVQIDVTHLRVTRASARRPAPTPAGTSSSSAPASPARRPRCCWPAPACGCWSSTAPDGAPTPCPRTR